MERRLIITRRDYRRLCNKLYGLGFRSGGVFCSRNIIGVHVYFNDRIRWTLSIEIIKNNDSCMDQILSCVIVDDNI